MRTIGGQGRPIVKGGSHQSCSLVFLFSKTALVDPFAAAEGFYMGLDRNTREGRGCGRRSPIMYTSFFVQSNGIGGAVYCGGENFRRGLIRDPGKAVVGEEARGRVRQSF
jgi:hypothetical protein